jgi:hypothetical protein
MYTLQTLLRDACNDSGEVEFRHNYSGRAMYGRECVGITGDMSDCMLVIGEIIKQQKEEPSFDDDVDTLLDFKTDSMGRDVIVYWPQLEGIEAGDEPENDGQPTEEQEWHDFDPDC